MKNTIILITPPFVQLNAPYPGTAFLAGSLKAADYQVKQIDLSIQTARALFNSDALEVVFDLAAKLSKASDNIQQIVANRQLYLSTIDEVMQFLGGVLPVLAYKIASRRFLPEAFRFEQLKQQKFKIEALEYHDGARYLASLYLDDLADLIQAVAPHFGLSRYAEKLVQSQGSFDKLNQELKKENDPVMQIMLDLLAETDFSECKFIGLSVPFPGNLFSALKCAAWLKAKYPQIPVVLGGGYVNTELRQMSDTRLFSYIDYLVFDDGEEPLQRLAEFIDGKIAKEQLERTMYLDGEKIVFAQPDAKSTLPTVVPDYSDFDFSQYISIYENPNPMFRLWSEKGFLKLRLAHGCYWHKCAFCDVTLDYIANYQPLAVSAILNQIETLIAQTGSNSFHFVDEALPPALITAVAEELLRRNIKIYWWGNIRFESSFTPDVCRLLALSGCIAVSGGLEAANERVLKMMNKGTTAGIAAAVCRSFKKQGVLVHAYLIYGFPGQLDRETVESLEIVRQFFSNKLLDSVYWHRFSMTVHSLVGKDPQKYGVKVVDPQPAPFANNDLAYTEKNPDQHHDRFAFGLNKAVYNFMHNIGIDFKMQQWFDFKIPELKVERDFLQKDLQRELAKVRNWRPLWLGGAPELIKSDVRKEKIFRVKGLYGNIEYSLPGGLADWLHNLLENASGQPKSDLRREDYEKKFPLGVGIVFNDLMRNELWQDIQKAGLFLLN